MAQIQQHIVDRIKLVFTITIRVVGPIVHQPSLICVGIASTQVAKQIGVGTRFTLPPPYRPASALANECHFSSTAALNST